MSKDFLPAIVERKRQEVENQRRYRGNNVRAKKQMDEEQSEQKRREPYNEQSRFICQDVKAE